MLARQNQEGPRDELTLAARPSIHIAYHPPPASPSSRGEIRGTAWSGNHTLYNSFYKLILHSLYGKCAQGDRRRFELSTGGYDIVVNDSHTNPDFVRATHRLTLAYELWGMTTDGLFTPTRVLQHVNTPEESTCPSRGAREHGANQASPRS